jgi:hypothetical protein
MKYLKTIFIFLISFNMCSAQEYQSKDELEKEIIGTWYREIDEDSKYVFSENGWIKHYYINKFQDSSTYAITANCGNENLANSQYFLKETYKNGSTECAYIEGINVDDNSFFSLMTKNGKVVVFKKECR